MSALEYDISHFPFSRCGAMVAISRDPVKDELVLHDARAHDGQNAPSGRSFPTSLLNIQKGQN